MPTLSANAPDTVSHGTPFNVGAVLTGGPANASVQFVLAHVVGPGIVPAWAPLTASAVTTAAGAAAVSFTGVTLATVGMHGLGCAVHSAAGGVVATDAESVLVQ